MPTVHRRTVTKLVRLHPAELPRIAARAEACRLKPARYIRETTLGAVPKARHHLDTDRLLRSSAGIGRILGQAARLTQPALQGLCQVFAAHSPQTKPCGTRR